MINYKLQGIILPQYPGNQLILFIQLHYHSKKKKKKN